MNRDGPIGARRRDLLRFPLLAAARAVALASPVAAAACSDPPRPAPQVPMTASGIDVHCHVFNARDLPIPGFVLHVVLEKDPLAELQLGPLVTFLALLIDIGTRTPDAEIARLRNGTEREFGVAFDAGISPPAENALYGHALQAALAMQAPDPRSQTVIDQVMRVLPRRSAALVHGLALNGQTSSFLGALAGMTPDGPVPGAGSSVGDGPTGRSRLFRLDLPSTQREQAEAAARGVANHARNKSGVFYLAELVTRPRAELVRRLVTLPAEERNGGIALFTPALIDFSFWLDHRANDGTDTAPAEEPAGVSSLADQVAVMSLIASPKAVASGATRHYAVHPFVSYCPWRQVADEQRGLAKERTQLGTVMDAIRNKGFIGVKLYPVMGFRPIGNALERSPSTYPARLRLLKDWAAHMDRSLEALYTFCVDEDVPVMAHCSFSQYPSLDAGLRGGPGGWWDVLGRWRTLRLNLAHAGGVWDLAPDRAAGVRAKAKGLWPVEVVGRLGRPECPNLYADLADFDGVLACKPGPGEAPGACRRSVDGEPALARLVEEVACNPGARKRLMYGTDYMFLIQAAGTEDYSTKMRECLAPALGMVPADLMGLNAASFLGLTKPGSGTRMRLDRFRGDDFLARWNSTG